MQVFKPHTLIMSDEARRFMAQSERDSTEVKRIKKLFWDTWDTYRVYDFMADIDSAMREYMLLVENLSGD
jgi:hypothetical protein